MIASLDTVAFGGVQYYFDGGNWSPEELLHGFMLAAVFRGMGHGLGRMTIKKGPE